MVAVVAEAAADDVAVSEADGDVVNVVGAARATGSASEAPVATVTPTTNPTAAKTPPIPSHGNNFDDESRF
ncbi:hypothetical protein MSAR_39880 [Mycolicibacterium sarraceniae]|uniref:Uncharacterized protein n=1 Tax=Mycolicibacterium sarraceniae TaxID=1534348 RepID=A0A7I7SV02_9MYCO|nr:hypothetical protein MSAR_39880 [Mycolicibacterium sarraceniae]